MGEIDHEYTEEVVCPWCGCEFSDSWEFSDDGELDCYECGKSFDFYREISCSYVTKRTPCKNGEHILALYERYSGNPYLYNNKNWTVWECEICKMHVIKVSHFVGNEPRLELPSITDFYNN